jgi:tetratricopeptide (TPR) repeat protein
MTFTMNADRVRTWGFCPAGALLALVLQAAGEDDFRWSWGQSNPPASPPASTSGAAFSWGWQPSGGAVRAAEPVSPAAPVTPVTPVTLERPAVVAAPAGVDASAYNELLRENLALRRKLTDAGTSESYVVRENQRLTADIKSMEAQMSKLAASLQDLRQKEPAGTNTKEMEARLASVEAERERLRESLSVLSREAEARKRASESAPIPAAPPTRPPPGSQVEPGSDLFRRLEKENMELHENLTKLEGEHKRTVEEQEKIARDEARTKEAVVELSTRERILREELAAAAAEAKEREKKNKDLMQRLPRMETDLAALAKDVEAKAAALAERNRQVETLKEELRRREQRLTGVERTAAVMEQAKREVERTAEREKRDMHYNMGAMYARDGKFRNAEQEYLKALQIDPADPDTHYNLGILYDENLGEKSKAAMHYRRFLLLRPHGPDADTVKGWLMAIEIRY